MKRDGNKVIFTTTEIKQIIKWYNKDMGLALIGENYGVTAPTIRRVLVENNVTIRGRGRPVTV